jgi:CheY-like chemotaxis protein
MPCWLLRGHDREHLHSHRELTSRLPSSFLFPQAGGNDYVTKPFGQKELVARIQVQLRTKQFTQGVQQPGRGEGEGGQLSPARSLTAPQPAANGVAAAPAAADPKAAAPAAQQQEQQQRQVNLLQQQLLAAQQQLAALAAANGPAAGIIGLSNASDAHCSDAGSKEGAAGPVAL